MRETVTDETERVRREYLRRDRSLHLLERYRLMNRSQLFLVQHRERQMVALLARHGFDGRIGHARVLDVGCGAGGTLIDLLRYGARADYLAGIDIVPERVEQARARLPLADLTCGSAERLPYADHAFDLVCQFTMLTTVLDTTVRQRIAAEMRRVVRPDGLILWHDLLWRSPGNPSVRAINPAEIRALFPDCRIDARRATLAPPLARLTAPRAWLLAEALATVPLLRSHLLAAIRPPEVPIHPSAT